MVQFRDIRQSFASGELSEKLRMRTDVDEWKRGLSEASNVVVDSVGGVYSRMGSQLIQKMFLNGYSASIGNGQTATDNVTLIPFFNGTETIIISIIYVKRTSPASNSFFFYGNNIYGIPVNFPLNEYVCTQYDDKYYTSKGWSYVNVGNFLFLTHDSGWCPPLVIERTLSNTYVLGRYTTYTNQTSLHMSFRVPYEELSGTCTYTVIGASKYVTFPEGMFSVEDLYKYILLDDGTNFFAAEVTGYTSLPAPGRLEVTEFFRYGTFASGQTFPICYKSAWMGTSLGAYPKYITYYNNRLIFANSRGHENDLWASMSGNLWFMRQPRMLSTTSTGGTSSIPDYKGSYIDSDPFDLRPGDGQTFHIKWLYSGKQLSVGTSGGEYVINEVNGVFSSTNSSISQQSTKGGISVQPKGFGIGCIFVDRSGQRICHFKYSEENGMFVMKDLSNLADHMVYHNKTTLMKTYSFVKLTWDGSSGILWCLTSGGELVGITHDVTTGVLAWHKHKLGAPNDDFKIIDIEAVMSYDPSFAGNYLAVVVKRLVNASYIYTLERIGTTLIADTVEKEWPATDESSLPWWVDCALKLTSASPTSSWTIPYPYINIHNGQEVSVIVDGIYKGEVTLNGDTLTTPVAGEYVILGYKYTKRIKTYGLDLGSPIGSSQEALRRVVQTLIHMYRSKGGKYGADLDNLSDIEYKLSTDDEKRTLETKDFVVTPFGSSEVRHQLIISEEDPLPFNITGITFKGELMDW